MERLTEEQKIAFTKDYDNDGTPDIVDNTDELVRLSVSQQGKGNMFLQKKLTAFVFRLLGKKTVGNILKQIAAQDDATEKETPPHSQSQNMYIGKGTWSRMSESKKELFRIFLILDAAVFLFVMYYFFGR
ncbi:MAG: hypothetical protein UV82_C0002G0034 [Candidatus Magasanikbacteria bacterium GW2011_GWD2_43_18]|uniref:Uncharacterized protein n=1 Tax=Candidatus Magasanikbacteria bacterium GW2011_GWE2_42_7 TaxID=1619052 RepID=A0A0G1BEG4_9BACT|nr:MAG: hypothetical protein UV18_C0003G0034 [Candidatus Magasanikbacteria bacterium GW2011_GWC2_42_27]KKS71672.1 MAG: hypothetical protein UV42_C0022G0002 [Candidatus Magasanikbacteria bacterium GW2011_GWE2_42_7]KKT05064.1 MAG: hypothetical protein UV82_C0002G0034 [Candidatus Magasanikbacteria bacterium GW2011_GWD2_43_18]HBB38130.1 hypothetical protein [Candidatus Magasanikbacteria bacterium]HCC13165.1 hypothetical protein [Candidatus Magasanikbacteria bacterium]